MHVGLLEPLLLLLRGNFVLPQHEIGDSYGVSLLRSTASRLLLSSFSFLSPLSSACFLLFSCDRISLSLTLGLSVFPLIRLISLSRSLGSLSLSLPPYLPPPSLSLYSGWFRCLHI